MEAERFIEWLKIRLSDSEKAVEDGHKAAEDSQRAAESNVEALKITLFRSWRIAKQYDEAEKTYKDVLANCRTEADADISETMLNLKYSFVEMLIEQKRFNEAETVAEEVWEKRKGHDPLPEASKMSHRQLCSVYGSLRKFEKAESMHRLVYDVYQEGSKDDWTLENGDGICKQLTEQRQYEKAELQQLDVWNERKKPGNQGPRHKLTLQSGLARIFILERLSAAAAALEDQACSEEDKDHNRHRKQYWEYKVDEMLGEIWSVREKPEQLDEILDVGHKMGSRLVKTGNFTKAESVLDEVWEGKKLKYGEANASTMSTGRLLADTLKLLGTAQSWQRAAAIYRKIWSDKKSIVGEGDDATISIGTDLAQTLYSLENYAGAEDVYRWVLKQIGKKPYQIDFDPLNARYNLGQAVYMQGGERYQDVVKQLREVYKTWHQDSPKSPATLQCGHMLIESLAGQAAVDKIREVFDGRAALEGRDLLYLESGHWYGKLLLQEQKCREAQEPLRMLWAHQPGSAKENEIRLRCGYLFGQSLFEDQKYTEAKDVLESVANDQRGVVAAGSSEVLDVSRLLGQVHEKIAEATQKKKRRRWN